QLEYVGQQSLVEGDGEVRVPDTGSAGAYLQRVTPVRDARIVRARRGLLLKGDALQRFVIIPFREEGRAAEGVIGAFEGLQDVDDGTGTGRIRIHEANVIQIDCDIGEGGLVIKVIGEHEV